MSTSSPVQGVTPVKIGFSGSAIAAALLSVALLAGLILWASFTMISGAVIVHGQTIVQGQARDIQHLDGGIVTKINVHNGDLVQEGDVLLELDATLLKVNIDIARTRLAEALAQKARLTAEQLGEKSLDVAAIKASTEASQLGDQDLDAPIRGQTQIMAARAEVLEGQREQLAEKKLQFDNQAAGLDALIASKKDQLTYLERDIANTQRLADSGLARESPLLEAKRDRAEILGQIASYGSDRAGIANSVRDAEIAAAQEERRFHEEVVTDLGEVNTVIGELVLQIVTTQKQLDRVEMRAPVTGIVHEMKVSTIGGVIAPGQTVLQIIPSDEALEFEMQLAAVSIDRVHTGQKARLRFSALDPRRTPDIFGQVSLISPTSITDEKTGQSFYRLRITVPPEQLERLDGQTLVPGMPVEGYLETGLRSAMDYLIQPLANHLDRAFREK